MDDSSKNIVKFVAALTGAILLLMAAWYFAKARENSDAAAAAATEASALAKEAKEKADKAEQVAAEAAEAAAAEENANAESEAIEEEIPMITGSPTADMLNGPSPEPAQASAPEPTEGPEQETDQ